MYDPFPFEDIEFSPCFSSAVSFFNVEERRFDSDFDDEVPALNFDDILRYPGNDEDYSEQMGEKRKKGDEGERIGLGLLFDEVSQTYVSSRRGNVESDLVGLSKGGEENIAEGTNPSSPSGRNARWISLASPHKPTLTPHSKATAGRAPRRGGKAVQEGARVPSSTRVRSRAAYQEWYVRPYTTGTDSNGYMCPPRGGVPPQLAREITRDSLIQAETKGEGTMDGGELKKRKRKRKAEDGCTGKAGKRMRA
ncbi:hypothetical protein EDD16DRAFT_1578204 [Pisolithus croceorrhizus]|nr:hypothetical protein EDD16DRAFT_1578204 [Pisolithus croceorrhizus]KAI6130623.1 hypothetical protein EV401DRAFT_1884407 [Pisolithus croceorrhizus]KAI6161773.1 hypothetical protein EDD17DRAFT_1582476 [Pisolithus thermaeus]